MLLPSSTEQHQRAGRSNGTLCRRFGACEVSVARTKSSSFISQVHALPSGVIGHVLTYIPRNDTAQLVHDAWRRGDLRLKYLRRLQISNSDLNAEMLSGLAPSVCGSNVYGDDDAPMVIIRTHITVGERLRLYTRARSCIA